MTRIIGMEIAMSIVQVTPQIKLRNDRQNSLTQRKPFLKETGNAVPTCPTLLGERLRYHLLLIHSE